jgi:hypothetical protein
MQEITCYLMHSFAGCIQLWIFHGRWYILDSIDFKYSLKIGALASVIMNTMQRLGGIPHAPIILKDHGHMCR